MVEGLRVCENCPIRRQCETGAVGALYVCPFCARTLMEAPDPPPVGPEPSGWVYADIPSACHITKQVRPCAECSVKVDSYARKDRFPAVRRILQWFRRPPTK